MGKASKEGQGTPGAVEPMMMMILLWCSVGTFCYAFSGFVFQVGDLFILQAVSTPCCSLWLYVPIHSFSQLLYSMFINPCNA